MKTVLNDLYDYDMQIYQLEEGFKFSLDSLLLAEFVKIKNKNQKIVDFCTGNAAIPLVLSTKVSNKLYGLEIQEVIFNLAQKSIRINNKDEQITIINDNILNSKKYFKSESIDVVTCNPPYFKYNQDSMINKSEIKAIARHEITLDLQGIIETANAILKNNGEFYIVYPSSRLEELAIIIAKNNFHIKELVPIYTKRIKNCEIVLIKAIKNSKFGLKILPAIYIEDLKSFQNIF